MQGLGFSKSAGDEKHKNFMMLKSLSLLITVEQNTGGSVLTQPLAQ